MFSSKESSNVTSFNSNMDSINDEEELATENCIDFILTNACSHAPKITSLNDMMIHEMDLAFAAISETWFKDSARLTQELGDLEHQSHL